MIRATSSGRIRKHFVYNESTMRILVAEDTQVICAMVGHMYWFLCTAICQDAGLSHKVIDLESGGRKSYEHRRCEICGNLETFVRRRQ